MILTSNKLGTLPVRNHRFIDLSNKVMTNECHNVTKHTSTHAQQAYTLHGVSKPKKNTLKEQSYTLNLHRQMKSNHGYVFGYGLLSPCLPVMHLGVRTTFGLVMASFLLPVRILLSKLVFPFCLLGTTASATTFTAASFLQLPLKLYGFVGRTTCIG